MARCACLLLALGVAAAPRAVAQGVADLQVAAGGPPTPGQFRDIELADAWRRVVSRAAQDPPRRTATRTVVTHTAIGAAGGALFATLWRYATPPSQRSETLTTWTLIGAGTGALSGVLTVWLSRPRSAR